jgi:hypothetical protein
MTLSDLTPGMLVFWINLSRPGFPIPRDVIVKRVCKVRIEVLLTDGTRVERVVDPSSLRPRHE